MALDKAWEGRAYNRRFTVWKPVNESRFDRSRFPFSQAYIDRYYLVTRNRRWFILGKTPR